MVEFFMDHKKNFPNMWIKVQCEAARSAVEVGCERFFSVSGYVSAPRQNRLGVRTYERLVLMAVILNTIYIDKNGWRRSTCGDARQGPGAKRGRRTL